MVARALASTLRSADTHSTPGAGSRRGRVRLTKRTRLPDAASRAASSGPIWPAPHPTDSSLFMAVFSLRPELGLCENATQAAKSRPMPAKTQQPPRTRPEFNWDDARVLLAVARKRTLRGAAAELDVNASTIGRRLDALESAL